MGGYAATMLRVRLLGELALESDARAVAIPPAPATRGLLGWLALHPGPHDRADLAARLWPQLPDDEAAESLRAAVDELAEVLGSDGLATTQSDVTLGAGAQPWVDAREFAEQADAGELGAAAEVARGELLAGLEAEWIEQARDAHRARLLGVFEALTARAEEMGDLEAAARWTQEQAALDPLSEERHRALITRLAAVGDRAGAMAAYEGLRERLRSDLRIKPSAETQALIERLG